LGFNPLNEQENNDKPSFGERLGLIAVMITAIGDLLAVVSARILIDEGIEEAKSDAKEKKEQEQQLTKMQNQIDSLQRELRLMKKESNN
jgi:hypothetical protein